MIAVISDVHGNLHALEAVLERVAAEGADEIWFLGDAVGYGARPEDCCRLLAERADIALAGNHDLTCVGKVSLSDYRGVIVPTFAWTRAQLSEASFDWLDALEPALRPEGRSDVGLYHASPRDPVWEYVNSVPQMKEIWEHVPDRLILVGHSHIAFAYQTALVAGRHRNGAREDEWVPFADSRWIMNPGSVGQPRDEDWRASALLLDIEHGVAEGRFKFIRVEYDVARSAAEITASEMPDDFGDRLYHGV